MFVHLTENAQWRIGLVPRGPVEPAVYGLTPLFRRNGGWVFRVETPWRWAYVCEAWQEWATNARGCL